MDTNEGVNTPFEFITAPILFMAVSDITWWINEGDKTPFESITAPILFMAVYDITW